MNCSLARRLLILLWGAGAGLYPLFSCALGLGDLQVQSRLNQPLRARIEVSDISDDEWRQLRAHLGSQQSTSDGLSRPGLLESMTFRNVEDDNHRRFIEVKSAEVFTEPLFDLSIDVTGADFDVTRNYTVFLDPPGPHDDLPGAHGPMLASQPAAAVKQAVHSQVVTSATHKKTPAASAPSSAGTAPPAHAAELTASTASYTVTKADTLEKIARRFGGTTAANRNQFMDWMFQHNPTAFYGDVNRLRAGARLALPESAAAAAMSATPVPASVSGGKPSGGQVVTPAAKTQLQGELTDLQQELKGLQQMIAQQDAQIASLKQQLAAREEPRRLAQAPEAREDQQASEDQQAREDRVAATQKSAAASATAALEHADQSTSNATESGSGTDLAQANQAAAAVEPPAAASAPEQAPGLWTRYHLRTSVFYWFAAIVALAGLFVWLVFYIRGRLEEANPDVQLRYPIGPSFERSTEAPQARVALNETMPMVRSPGSASAAAKLSAALKRREVDDTAEVEAAHEFEDVPEEPPTGLETWRTQTALLEQDILSETDVLPFVLDTRNQLRAVDEDLLSPSELTQEAHEIEVDEPLEDRTERFEGAPTERLPRMVAEEIAARAAREQTARLPTAVEKSAGEKAAGEKAAGERATGERAAAEKPAGEKPAAEKLASVRATDELAARRASKDKGARPPADTVAENTSELPTERSATNTEIVKALETSLDYQPDRVDIQLKLLEIYHHEALDNRENFHSMLRKLADLKNLSPAQRLHVEMLQRTLQDGDSSFVAEEEM